MKLLIGMAIAAATVAATAAPRQPPIVIAHRGASGLRPEHTLAAYRLAIKQGADFIEPDIVITRDGVLVARHENEISGTTDVAAHAEFADRRTTRFIDGRAVSGWFVEDFTLAEIKRLRARERLAELRPANRTFDGQESVPTLQEVVDLVRAEAAGGRHVGLYIETKHPGYFRAKGLPLEERLVTLLRRNGYSRRSDPVFIQSFEVSNLKALRKLTRLRLVQLLGEGGGPADAGADGSYARMATPAGLAAIARYADAIGPAKTLVMPRDGEGRSGPPTQLVAEAHRQGLLVHPWTFRNENAFLPLDLRRGADPRAHGDARQEYAAFYRLGVDGLFSDFPGDAIAAREDIGEAPSPAH